MRFVILIPVLAASLASCAGKPATDPLKDYDELDPVTMPASPAPVAAGVSAAQRAGIEHGRYLVELLGCGACHTEGALVGDPDPAYALAGSTVGIAFENPLGDERPGVIYAPNLTPDLATGIGNWSDAQIAAAIRAGRGRHAGRSIAVMPWQGYAQLTDDDVADIVAYLRSIDPVSHQVPQPVAPGTVARTQVVYFGVYRRR